VNLVMDPPDGDDVARPLAARRTAAGPRDGAPPRGAGADGRGGVHGLVRVGAGEGVPIDLLRTETFTLLAFTQWFNVLNCRSATRSALVGAHPRNAMAGGGPRGLGRAAGAGARRPAAAGPPTRCRRRPGCCSGWWCWRSTVPWVEEARKLVVRRRARR
jgi:Ca2+-transporting ATPase